MNPQQTQLAAGAGDRPDTESRPGVPLALRYRKLTVYLLIFYVPLLVIPWVLTCVMSGSPAPNGNSGQRYFPQYGLAAHGVYSMLSWVAAIRTLNSIASVATIPVTSTLLAQAAVVYTQKRKALQRLTLRQLFALADRRWSDVTAVLEAARTAGRGIGSPFLWLGMGLIALSAVQHPLQQLLVSWESIPVMTCLDNPTGACGSMTPVVVGYDPEPADLATIHQNRVVQEVMSSLATFNMLDLETHLWPDPSYLDDHVAVITDPTWRQTLRYWAMGETTSGDDVMNHTPNFFVTALQNATGTGVLREHALRFNSSAWCDKIPRAKFPEPCPGKRPFYRSLSKSPFLDIRVCAPGEYGVHPWSLSRNRQEIGEDLYLDVVDGRINTPDPVANFTLHCRTSTTRGYFELGNHMNSQIYGPLLGEWPDPDTMAREFNDELNLQAGKGGGPPTESDETHGYHRYSLNMWNTEPADPYGTYMLNTSGPLMTTAIALFGNQSFFEMAANASDKTFPPAAQQICQQGRLPFSNLGITVFNDFQRMCGSLISGVFGSPIGGEPDEVLTSLIGNWVSSFNDTTAAELGLIAGMYLSNRAMLTQTVTASSTFSARKIHFGAGMLVPFPVKTLAGTAVVSIFIFLQLVGLAYVTYYIYQLPTWTAALDAVAIARIGVGLRHNELPPLGDGEEVVGAMLNKVDGWIGLDAGEARLTLGGPGVITRRHATKKVKE
ncbi:uncharacterized protein BDW47DRAFT_117926 [Aspergillus candidus]|uniref:Uncharacterized protein n=1 Tax=Aspergillus candidus TaxID=41067 RepID=A0A2I2FA81_ASPCN|nr:hypothetical protein BDW47DRAFT_117926 [Aspergillus candidus]PLB37508.1 hypothetical protein BDW47DRAFT_117926 [Aspergillus candidus]